MDYVTPYMSKVKSARSEIIDFVEDGMESHESEIRQWIKDRWLLGNDPDGNAIGVYRSHDYEMFKSQMNPSAGGAVDLTLTGALGNKIQMHSYGTTFEIFSTDEKFDMISQKYGDYNFNITDKEKEALLNEVGGEVINRLFEMIWLA